MNENDVPPPTDLHLACNQANTLTAIQSLLAATIDLLKQLVVNTTPKKPS